MLIFFAGSIGDTLIMLPFLRKVRQIFPGERLSLLHDSGGGDCRELLEKTGYIDEFFSFSPGHGIIARVRQIFQLWQAVHASHDTRMLYMLRSQEGMKKRIKRDIHLFSLFGIRDFLGTDNVFEFKKTSDGNMAYIVPHHIDLLARRLSASGITLSPSELNCFDLHFQPDELSRCAIWRKRLRHAAGNRQAIVVGVGGNKSVCRWPTERYIEVLLELIENDNVFPVFFGGASDDRRINEIKQQLPLGASANDFGTLTLRESIEAMRECNWYLGNDTGTLHMAVAAGLKCVAIYSAHNYRGLWYPWGDGHRVLRSSIACECCYRPECPRGNPPECLLRISVADVLREARNLIKNMRLSSLPSGEGVDK